MGYTSGWTSKTELVEELLHAPSGVLKVIDHALVGNHLWTVRQFTEDTDRFKTGFRFVQLYLLSSYHGSWGYKGLCESDHLLLRLSGAPAGRQRRRGRSCHALARSLPGGSRGARRAAGVPAIRDPR